MIDLPPLPKLWLPPKPAIIRSARGIDIPLRSEVRRRIEADQATFPFPVVVGRPAAMVTYQATASQEVATATNTFAGMALGTAAANRYIIVGVTGRTGSTGTTFTSVTVGGITASAVVTRVVAGDLANGENFAGLFIATVPTGATGSVVIVTNNVMVRMGVVVWSAVNLSSATATATGSSSASAPTASLNVAAGGFALGAAYSQSATTTTWAGITEVVDTQITAANTYTGASSNFAAAQTSLAMTATFAAGAAPAGAFAAFR